MRRRRRTKKPHEPLKLGDFLRGALSQHNIHLDSFDANLITIWTRAVGPQIAAQTEPYKYGGKTLFVRVATSTWMLQLQFMKQEIIEKINALTGADTVNAVFFTVGQIAAPESPDSPGSLRVAASVTHLSSRDMKLIEESASLVRDEELRSAIQRVMKKNIINRKRHGTP